MIHLKTSGLNKKLATTLYKCNAGESAKFKRIEY